MRVLILGATGRVGRHIVADGILRGCMLTALVRDPEKLSAFGDRIHILRGDALDGTAIANAVAGQDGVIHSLGVSTTRSTTLFSESTRILVAAMHQHGVRRLIAITGVGAGETRGHGGFLYDHIIYPLFTKNQYLDKEVQEAIIRNTDLDWTIVRPAPFRPGAGREEIQVATNVGNTVLRRVSPAEVARFVLDELAANRYIHATLFIGHPH